MKLRQNSDFIVVLKRKIKCKGYIILELYISFIFPSFYEVLNTIDKTPYDPFHSFIPPNHSARASEMKMRQLLLFVVLLLLLSLSLSLTRANLF